VESDLLVCIFCGLETSDWWFSDRKLGTCRCRSCYKKGISETQEEINKRSSFVFNPVENRDMFTSEFLQEKKSLQESKEQLHIIRFAPKGSLIEFSPRLTPRVRRPSARGEVAGFSVRSRSRLNKTISTINKNHLPCFVTLTYHNDFPVEFEDFKYHLHHFFIMLKRKFPKVGIIWKLEYQKRGAPHYHLLVWGVPVEELQVFVPDAWHKVVYSDLGFVSAHHLAWHKGELGNGNEHCVTPVRSWNGVTSYSAKYFSKLDDSTSRGGRIWGVRGAVPFSPILTFRVNLDVALDFRKQLATARQYEFQRLGFWCGDYHVDWLLLLDDLINYYHSQKTVPDDPPDWDLQEAILFEDVFGFEVNHVAEPVQ